MLCPVDRQTYTIRMEIDGIVKQFCQTCRTYHEPTTEEADPNRPHLPTDTETHDRYRDKQR
jgi:hypothetical protein